MQLLTQALVAPGVVEKPVSFMSEGQTVRGVWSAPQDGTVRELVVFSHGWSGNRNGPAGVLTALSRALAAQGCACLRFDFRGRGESGGDGLGATLATMSQDLKAAVAFASTLAPACSPCLLGMCSGGNIAIGSLKELPKIKAMALLSVYPFSDGDSFGRDVHRTWHFLNVYLHKACSLNTWKRLLTGDASLKRAFGVVFRPFLKRGENRQKEEGNKVQARTVKASGNESRLQAGKEAPKKYLSNLERGGRILMLYGTGDPDAAAAYSYYHGFADEHHLPIAFEQITGANHNFSSLEWRRQVTALVLNHLKSKP